MKQFDLYKNTDDDSNETYPYLVDIQNDLLDAFNSRTVIPLATIGKSYPANLCPVITINNKKYALLTHQITSVSAALLKTRVGTLLNNRDQIVAAIDFLVTGI